MTALFKQRPVARTDDAGALAQELNMIQTELAAAFKAVEARLEAAGYGQVNVVKASLSNVPLRTSLILVDPAPKGAVKLLLPQDPPDGWMVTIKDAGGAAAGAAITIYAPGKTIDGAATATISANYGKTRIQYNEATGAFWTVA